MKKRLSKIFNYVVIFGTLLVVLIIGITSKELDGALEALRSLGFGWVVLCLIGYAGNMSMEAVAIWYFMRRQGCRVSFAYTLFVSIAGLYYSNITPGASGGQPMQVYYLHKKGVPIGMATSAMLVRFFSFQFMLEVAGTVLWIAYGKFIDGAVAGYKWFMVFGYVYNMLVVSGIVLVCLKRGIVRTLCRFFVRIGIKLRLVRHPDTMLAKCDQSVDAFHDSILLLTQRPLDLVVQMLIGGLQLMFQMTILYMIYLGLHQSGVSYGQLVAVDVMEYLSAAWMPLPGAAGAQEVTFTLYFGEIFPEGIRLAALLLWRFFTYYLQLLVGAVITVGFGWMVGTGRKAVLAEAEHAKEAVEAAQLAEQQARATENEE